MWMKLSLGMFVNADVTNDLQRNQEENVFLIYFLIIFSSAVQDSDYKVVCFNAHNADNKRIIIR